MNFVRVFNENASNAWLGLASAPKKCIIFQSNIEATIISAHCEFRLKWPLLLFSIEKAAISIEARNQLTLEDACGAAEDDLFLVRTCGGNSIEMSSVFNRLSSVSIEMSSVFNRLSSVSIEMSSVFNWKSSFFIRKSWSVYRIHDFLLKIRPLKNYHRLNHIVIYIFIYIPSIHIAAHSKHSSWENTLKMHRRPPLWLACLCPTGPCKIDQNGPKYRQNRPSSVQSRPKSSPE